MCSARTAGESLRDGGPNNWAAAAVSGGDGGGDNSCRPEETDEHDEADERGEADERDELFVLPRET